MTDEPQAPVFVPGAQVKPGAYSWWCFPLALDDGRTVANLVLQGPGGDSHYILAPDDMIKFGAYCVQQAKQIRSTPSKLIVPDVQVPPDLLGRNGHGPG